jgi:hypothetical protein
MWTEKKLKISHIHTNATSFRAGGLQICTGGILPLARMGKNPFVEKTASTG